jgi:DNA polymerase-3 subunit gamma/tau
VNSGSYIVLARKWRPAQFSDIVGQAHIVRTLMNAIRAQRIHSAYLFTGSRGIGKTSIARIFAKVIRCENATTDADGWLRSCDQCASCKEITAGTSVDVIEIDGASNNGVEAVREIRENAKYMPANGSRKIYIIDEVHMLTTPAFNALLKTLEEPPAHVLFIFATTEPHKIPATILSRCQRFDYRRVTISQIQTRLEEVSKAEGIQAEPAALALISRAAEGGMRDAMSMLDQVISFSGNSISAQAVRDSIGLIEGQTLLGIISGVFSRKPLEALALVEQAYQRGHDLRVLTRSLIEFLHGAVLAKIGASHSTTLELSEEEWKELRSISEARSLEEIELIFQVLHHGLEWIARSPQPKIVLDILLVKCATAEALVFVGDAQAPGSGGNGGASPQEERARPSPQQPASKPAQPHAQHAAHIAPIAPIAPSQAPAPSVAKIIIHAQATTPVAAAHAIAEALEHHTPAVDALAEITAQGKPIVQRPAPVNLAPPLPTSTQGPRTWEGFISLVRQTRPLLASILEHGHCDEVPENDNLLSICYPLKDAYFREQLGSRVYNEQLLTLSKDYFGRLMRVQVELRDGGESVAARRERELKARETQARSAAQNHPIILEAKALFGGELGPIELTEAAIGGGDTHVHP